MLCDTLLNGFDCCAMKVTIKNLSVLKYTLESQLVKYRCSVQYILCEDSKAQLVWVCDTQSCSVFPLSGTEACGRSTMFCLPDLKWGCPSFKLKVSVWVVGTDNYITIFDCFVSMAMWQIYGAIYTRMCIKHYMFRFKFASYMAFDRLKRKHLHSTLYFWFKYTSKVGLFTSFTLICKFMMVMAWTMMDSFQQGFKISQGCR